MSNLGRYQDIVEEAHNSGGVDVWLNEIKNAAYNKGVADTEKDRISTLLWGVGIGSLVTITTTKIVKWVSNKKKEKLLIEQKAKEAEKQLKEKLDTTVSEPEEK